MSDALLLCTDLDRTLLPNGAYPESPRARALFARLVAHAAVTLAFVSGRGRKMIEDAIDSYALPVPDFVICDVGSSIYDLRSGEWSLSSHWHATIAPDWGGRDRLRLAELLADVDCLRPQEEAKQGTFKLSYYVPLDIDRTSTDMAIEARLRAHGVAASRIWSIDEAAQVGLLDVVPTGATKLHAVEFLRAEVGEPYDRVLFAGDSGNDLHVLASPIPSVLVANATPEVTREALMLATEEGHPETLYVARGGFMGMNGNYAAGILEGVAHFRPDLRPLMHELSRDLSI